MAKKSEKSSGYGLTRIRVSAYSKAMDGGKVKSLRDRAKLSQAEAAKSLGWTAQRWSDMENDRHPNPRLGTVLAICRVLGCEVTDLLRKQT
jgi:DNA-binding XRE family transcriptional regulator